MVVYEVCPRLAVSGALNGTMRSSFDFSVTTIENAVGIFKLFPESRDVNRRRFVIPRLRCHDSVIFFIKDDNENLVRG